MLRPPVQSEWLGVAPRGWIVEKGFQRRNRYFKIKPYGVKVNQIESYEKIHNQQR